jgi:ClpP class serine protease
MANNNVFKVKQQNTKIFEAKNAKQVGLASLTTINGQIETLTSAKKLMEAERDNWKNDMKNVYDLKLPSTWAGDRATHAQNELGKATGKAPGSVDELDAVDTAMYKAIKAVSEKLAELKKNQDAQTSSISALDRIIEVAANTIKELEKG